MQNVEWLVLRVAYNPIFLVSISEYRMRLIRHFEIDIRHLENYF